MANNGSSAPPPAGPSTVKKGKNKKTDPVDTNKLVEQTMARLERDMAGDREQEAEIGMSQHNTLELFGCFCTLGFFQCTCSLTQAYSNSFVMGKDASRSRGKI